MTEMSLIGALGALGAGIVAALAGGAIGGAIVAHGHMEKSLGAWMGSFYGPLGAVPGLIVGLAVLAVLSLGGGA